MTDFNHRLFDISGRRALVTGGNDGLGKMIATAFVQSGADVVIVGRKAEKTDAVARELSQLGPGKCSAIAADLGQLDDIDKVVSRISQEFSTGFDILVNNAGTTWGAPIDSVPVKGWDKVMNLNLKGTFYLTEALVPLLRSAATDDSWSRIINISSVGARFIDPTIASPPYAASKAALEQVTRIQAREHAGDKITVNCVAPGWFPTPLTTTVDWAAEQWREQTPLQRLGTPEDIGGLCIFLASRAGSYLTGQIIDIDGGHAVT